MRYSVISKGLTQSQLETEAKKIGAKDIKPAQHVGQVFCELDDEQARKLSHPGYR